MPVPHKILLLRLSVALACQCLSKANLLHTDWPNKVGRRARLNWRLFERHLMRGHGHMLLLATNFDWLFC